MAWGLVRKIYTNNCFTAELLAILEALYLVQKYNLPKAIIYSDRKDAIHLIMGGILTFMPTYLSCAGSGQRRPDLQIKHCNRKYNGVADLLAKACRVMDDDSIVTRIFPTLPSYCLEQLIVDCNMFNVTN